VTDGQGNIRGYATTAGLQSAYDYYAFGSVDDIMRGPSDDNKRWQGKEFDEPIKKLYFGARYFDPFFGLWLTPDPAGQFANPYSYGGDPISGVDLYGLWKIGFGITFGWENGGFTLGVGAACDVGNESFGVSLDVGATHNFRDGSKTYSASLGVSVNFWIVGLGAHAGYSYNTISGGVLNYGIRGSIYGAGVGFNGANYWDADGNYMGGTWAVEAFYGAFGAEGYIGYEKGYSGMEGRGWYAGARAWGLHAEYSITNNSWSYGASMKLANGGYDSKKGFDSYIAIYSLITDSFDESNWDEPERGEDLYNYKWATSWFDDLTDGWGAFGTNYVGATDGNILGTMPITDDLDRAAFWHDMAYTYAGADGVSGAFLNNKAGVIKADLKLAGRSFASAFSDTRKGALRKSQSVFTGILFGTLGVLKMTNPAAGSQRFRASPRESIYTDNLWW
jgi:RHS repeat-associated protein